MDINSASVEISRLALWLHTAKADQPLSKLDTNIVTGNSLVGEEMYSFKKDLLTATEEKKETINAFDYKKQFPTVFDEKRPGGEGFDCIVGNPPYVKLQNFKKVYPETADFLRNATGVGGNPRYASCQTWNLRPLSPIHRTRFGIAECEGAARLYRPQRLALQRIR